MQNTPNNVPNSAPQIPYTYQYSQKPKKEYKPIEAFDLRFIIAFFGACFLLIDFALFNGFHLGFTISYIVLFIVSSIYLYKKANRVSLFSLCCGALSVAASVTFTLYNDFFINSIMLILIGGLFVIYTIGFSNSFNYKQGSFKIGIDMLKNVFVYPFSNFADLFGSIKASSKQNKKSLGGLIGGVLAIPVLFIIVPLLVKSDAAFQGLVGKLAAKIGVYVAQIIIAIIVTPYAFSYMFSKRHKLNVKDGKSKALKKPFPSSACASFLGVISATYVVYLFSQLAYFFSAFKGILPEDYEYTASAFARRGFFEMFAICVINMVIIAVVSMLIKNKSKMFKILSCFVSLFSVLLIITAMQKMKLNISIYGLSKNRVLVTVFMVMLLIIFAFFILHIFVPKISYMQPIILVCSAIFIALSFCNIDAYIAKYNIAAFESGKIQKLDVEDLSNLSDDSIPYVVALCDNEDKLVSKQAIHIVTNLASDNYSDYLTATKDGLKLKKELDFRDYNVSKKNAIQSVIKVSSNPRFLNEYNIATNDDCWYDEDADIYYYYDYSNNKETEINYIYNSKTGMYDKTVVNNQE